jgi:hypothetical protein
MYLASQTGQMSYFYRYLGSMTLTGSGEVQGYHLDCRVLIQHEARTVVAVSSTHNGTLEASWRKTMRSRSRGQGKGQ